MLTTTILLVAIAVLVPCFTSANQGETGEEGRITSASPWDVDQPRADKDAELKTRLQPIFTKFALDTHLPDEEEDHIPDHPQFAKAFNKSMAALGHQEVPVPRWTDVDTDGNTGIDAQEFIDACRDSLDVATVFKSYADKSIGDIRDEASLRSAFVKATTVLRASAAVCPTFREVDKDGNGGIDLEEFEHVVKHAVKMATGRCSASDGIACECHGGSH